MAWQQQRKAHNECDFDYIVAQIFSIAEQEVMACAAGKKVHYLWDLK